MNLTYNVIYNGKDIDTSSIINIFDKFVNMVGLEVVGNQFLSHGNWKLDDHLFCVGVTPIRCFNLDSWSSDKDWTLLTFSDFPEKMLGWEKFLCESLATFMEVHKIYDAVNEFSTDVIGRKKQSDFSANGLEWHIPNNYYDLKKHPRENSHGEEFLVCRNDAKTKYNAPDTQTKWY